MLLVSGPVLFKRRTSVKLKFVVVRLSFSELNVVGFKLCLFVQEVFADSTETLVSSRKFRLKSAGVHVTSIEISFSSLVVDSFTLSNFSLRLMISMRGLQEFVKVVSFIQVIFIQVISIDSSSRR